MDRVQAEAEVKQLLARFAVAWNTHNDQEYTSCFAPEAGYATVQGETIQGHAAIRQRFLAIHRHLVGVPPPLRFEAVQITHPAPGIVVAVLEGTAAKPDRGATRKWVVSIMVTLTPNGEWQIAHLHAGFAPKRRQRWWHRAWARLRH